MTCDFKLTYQFVTFVAIWDNAFFSRIRKHQTNLIMKSLQTTQFSILFSLGKENLFLIENNCNLAKILRCPQILYYKYCTKNMHVCTTNLISTLSCLIVFIEGKKISKARQYFICFLEEMRISFQDFSTFTLLKLD